MQSEHSIALLPIPRIGVGRVLAPRFLLHSCLHSACNIYLLYSTFTILRTFCLLPAYIHFLVSSRLRLCLVCLIARPIASGMFLSRLDVKVKWRQACLSTQSKSPHARAVRMLIAPLFLPALPPGAPLADPPPLPHAGVPHVIAPTIASMHPNAL